MNPQRNLRDAAAATAEPPPPDPTDPELAGATTTPPAAGTAVQQREDPKIIRMLKSDQHRGELEAALPRGVDVDRFIRLARTAIMAKPDLLECDHMSLIAAVHRVAALGLEPNTDQQHCWLLPWKEHGRWIVQLVMGYRGMIALAHRHPKVVSVSAHEVCANDHFKYDQGTAYFLEHRKPLDGNRGPTICYYTLARYTNGYWFDVVTNATIEEHRKASKRADAGAWRENYDAMARKTCIRIAEPFLPASVELTMAMAADGTYQTEPDGEVQGGIIDGYLAEPATA